MKDLSICILAHTKTPQLEQVCASVSWAERILIMDNESGVEWANYFPKNTQLTVEKVTHPVSDFSQLRNAALDLCKTDWIFFIDSDEVLQTGSEMEFLRVLKSGAAAASITRSDVFQGHTLDFGEAGNQKIIRLCQVAKTRFTGSVHERAEVTGNVIPTDIRLQHFAHSSVSEFVAAVTMYAELAAQEARFAKMSRLVLLMQLCCFPLLKFFQNYFLRAGFRDGYAGLVYACCMSLHSLLVRIYAYERYYSTTTSH